MKKIVFSIGAFLVYCTLNAQLTIYSNLNLQGSSGTCVARTIYTDASIPSSLNDGIKSISLSQGYMATLAENADGSGERFSYMANASDLRVNLALVLQNKASFIRVLPLPTTPVKKKGAGATNNAERDALNVSWFYDWGFNDVSTTTQEFSPMMWGAYNSIETSINTVVNKTNVTHFMAFNEPDNSGQSGSSLITTDPLVAIPYYKKLLRAGQRMASPAPTENQYRVWLKDFADEADAQKLQIDVVAVHWYDWGNVCTNFTGCDLTMPIAGKTVDMNATNIFNRFKSWVDAVYQLHQKPLWITEFNAHHLRSDAVQAAFMNLALPWLDAHPNVERYAYFFGNDAPARNSDGTLTAAGQVYNNHASVNAYPANIYDKRPAMSSEVLAAWNPSSQIQGGRSVANFAPTFLYSGISAPTALSRGSGVVVPTTSASNGYWGGNDWSTTTAAAGVTANKFFQFSLRSTQTVSYHTIDKFNIRISNTGPIQYQIDYQIGSGAFSPCATVGITRPSASANFTLGPIDLSSISGLQDVAANQTVTFRITPFEATSSTGSFLIGSGTGDTEADLSIMGGFSSNLIVLPITLSDFQSKRIKDKVFLNWETQSAINFSHFIVERSTDGKTFYEIAKINGSNRTVGSMYDHTDDTPDATTTNYYRLKMVDLDGSFAYSKVLSENFDASNAPFMIYPSVSKGNTIEATFKKVSQAAQIKIFNASGQLINTYNLQVGTTAQTIETAHFTEGVYFLVLQDKDRIQSAKFIKQ
jgi:Glycosyl hydrolase catalytic core/Secretion system C-terminal sorting domain